MMVPVLIVPGLGGSGPDHWQTHLERSLPTAARVEQDDWDRPDLTSWTERLAHAVDKRPRAILVAHSLGCPLVAHLAARRPDLSIAAALLVAPADVNSARHTPSQTRSFSPIPLAPLPFRSIVVASSNDPFIEINRARELASAWGADFVDAGSRGHINVASGFGRWLEGERMVASLIEWASPPLADAAASLRGCRRVISYDRPNPP
jgi:predicted alpha/beta hydrolase family esterase